MSNLPTCPEALAAAQSDNRYEDEKGEWHSETVSGRDRPHAVVKDTNN